MWGIEILFSIGDSAPRAIYASYETELKTSFFNECWALVAEATGLAYGEVQDRCSISHASLTLTTRRTLKELTSIPKLITVVPSSKKDTPYIYTRL